MSPPDAPRPPVTAAERATINLPPPFRLAWHDGVNWHDGGDVPVTAAEGAKHELDTGSGVLAGTGGQPAAARDLGAVTAADPSELDASSSGGGERAALDALTIEHAHLCPSCCDQHCERAGALWERSETLLAQTRRGPKPAAATPREGGADDYERALADVEAEAHTHVREGLYREVTLEAVTRTRARRPTTPRDHAGR